MSKLKILFLLCFFALTVRSYCIRDAFRFDYNHNHSFYSIYENFEWVVTNYYNEYNSPFVKKNKIHSLTIKSTDNYKSYYVFNQLGKLELYVDSLKNKELRRENYSYIDNRLSKISINDTITVIFKYDSIGRLVTNRSINLNNDTVTLHYSYDKNGKIFKIEFTNRGIPDVWSFNYQGTKLDVYKNNLLYSNFTFDDMERILTQKVFGKSIIYLSYINDKYVFSQQVNINSCTENARSFMFHYEGGIINEYYSRNIIEGLPENSFMNVQVKKGLITSKYIEDNYLDQSSSYQLNYFYNFF